MGAERNVASGQEDLEREELRALEEFGRGLDEIERRMSEPTPRNFAKAKIYNARTRIEIAEARKVIRDWIEDHPEDRFEFGKYASDLWRREIQLDEMEGADGSPSPGPTS